MLSCEPVSDAALADELAALVLDALELADALAELALADALDDADADALALADALADTLALAEADADALVEAEALDELDDSAAGEHAPRHTHASAAATIAAKHFLYMGSSPSKRTTSLAYQINDTYALPPYASGCEIIERNPTASEESHARVTR